MNIEKVYYQRNFPVSPFLFEHIGVGYILNEGENPKEALEAAKALVNEYHKENMAELEQYRGTKTTTIEAASQGFNDIINKEFEGIKALLDEIEFREDAQEYINANYPDWKMAIDIKQLINQKPSKL